jgi:hypothetical protein
MAMLRLLAFTFALALNGRPSQPPSPSLGKVSIDNPTGTTKANGGHTQTQQAGSKDFPIFVEQVAAPKTAEDASKEQKADDDSAAAKRLNNRFTFALVLASGLQAVVAVFQFFLLRRQTTLINKQATLMERQTGIADRTLIATFRPRLLVRSVLLKQNSSAEESGNRDEPWRIKFTVSNVGGSQATIVLLVSGGSLIEAGKVPAEPPYAELIDMRPQLTLIPGQHQEFTVPVSEEIGRSLWEWNKWPSAARASYVFFLGYIRFVDEGKMTRSYGFCRLYDPDTHRFGVVQDPDYEYAD